MRYTRSPITVGLVTLALLAIVGAFRATLARDSVPAAPAAKDVLAPATPEYFDAYIAPLLARHCLECHDTSTKKGKLDLSLKSAAMTGGKHGKAIVPGKSADSLVWTSVESGEMPDDRPPLSAQEKKLLRDWIDAGAVWSGTSIDPAALHRDERAAQNWLRRLTVPEYIATVRSAVGVDIEADARRILPPDSRADGFSNTAYNLNVDLAHVEAYARLAAIVVGKMDISAFAGQFAKGNDRGEAAIRAQIVAMGKWLLRGPLQEPETAAFLGVYKTVTADGGSHDDAVSFVVEAMLQSPRFLYHIERHQPDGPPKPVDRYELASRMSYILWGAPPDKELFRAADAGELADPQKVADQVRRMLQDPRTVAQSRQFVADWLNLDRLANLSPNKKHFPNWNEHLAADMRAETLAFFEEIAWKQNRPLSDLLNAKVTFATPRLAEHYGLPRPQPAGTPARKRDGLLALYTFDAGGGDLVRDVSGNGDPLNLKIADPKAVRWSDKGLTIVNPATIASATPPKRLIDAIRQSKAITIEARITPADTNQAGPARIVTLSANSTQRNFTLGQDKDKFDVRLRSKKTDANGMPSLASPGGLAATRLTHVVYTRDAAGKAILYVDGEQQATRNVEGDLSNWDGDFRLALANEVSGDRPWRGTFHQVAIYSRALSAGEIGASTPAVEQRLEKYDLSSVPSRGGLLTQGSVLTIGGDEASMVARGLFVLKDLLNSAVGSAPPGVDTTPVPTKPGQSQRHIAEERLANTSCTGCHSRFEPLAFGLEKFDGIGAFHEKDHHGNKLREDGAILFPGENDPVRYKTSAELMDLLAGSDRVRMTLTRKLTQFALGRPLVGADEAELQKIHAAAQKDGGTYAGLISAIVMSDLVQKSRP